MRHPLFYLFVLFMLSAFVSIGVPTAIAQEGPTLAQRISALTKPISDQLDKADKALNLGELDDQALTKLRGSLEAISTGLAKRVANYQPDILALYLKLDRLPPVPGEGEPKEADEISDERTVLFEQKSKTLLAIKDAELLSVYSAALVKRVLEARRAFFISSLLKQRRLDAATFQRVWHDAPSALGNVWATISAWIYSMLAFHMWTLVGAFIAAGLLWALIFRGLRPFRRWTLRMNHAEVVAPLPRITLAFFSIIIPGFAIAALVFGLHHILSYAGLYRFRVDLIMIAFFKVVAGLAFVWLLLRAVLAPKQPQRRLVRMTTGAAQKLTTLGMFIAIIYCVDYFFSQIFVIFSSPVEFTVVKSLIATLLIAVALITTVMVRLNSPDPASTTWGYRGWKPVVYWLVWIGIFAIVLMELAGYVSLGRFIAGQIIIAGSILTTAYIGFQAARAIVEAGAIKPTRLGKFLQLRHGFSDMRLDQLGLVLSILINVLVVLTALPVLALQWGYKPDDVLTWATIALTGFSLGGFQFSIGRVLVAIVVFILLIVVTRFIRRWFDNKVLARTALDSGLKNSIRSGLGYVGYILAALVGLSWAGLNLSNLAIVAGALSVGIGFGLQNVVNNFVSGLIMLVERPIKVGDIITVGSSQGYVRKINVRATELETFERQSLIIPNSEVINTVVGNWMYKNHQRRVLIKIGVAYGSDVALVQKLLIKATEDDPRICTDPKPYVYFSDFGASSLDFQLRMIINDLNELLGVESQLRFKIVELFDEAGIEIPFPQQDVHLRSGLEALTQGPAKPTAKK